VDSSISNLKQLLDDAYFVYGKEDFINHDPIQIPFQFKKKEDKEIIAFIIATISWGIRKSIINNGNKLIELLHYAPYEFVLNAGKLEKKHLIKFVHRTFNGNDLIYFIDSIQHIYQHRGGLENIFKTLPNESNCGDAIVRARKIFFELPHEKRVEKHFSDPLKKATCKRILMFLRWMVRKDNIDFGIWKSIKTDQLLCPLDVHSGRVARKLELLKRTQNDFEAVIELTENLKRIDFVDPIKYDISLFSLGVSKEL
jgi:uncharacterized protein (TIGR02757 family)